MSERLLMRRTLPALGSGLAIVAFGLVALLPQAIRAAGLTMC